MVTKDSDIVSHLIGDFGKWQARITVLISLLKLPIGWFQLSIVFLAPATEFWCQLPVNVSSSFTSSPSQWKNQTLNDCHVQCSKYAFDTSIFQNTIISEWLLICNKEQLANVVQMTFMLGVLVGNVIFGIASDKYGRKNPLMIAIVVQGITSLLSAFVPWFPLFLLLRFFLAISTGGIMVTSFVICVEMVGGKWRTSIPILYQIPFGLASSLMALMAYFLRDWRMLTFTMSMISLSFVSYWWLIPESPRWLLAVGRNDKAARIFSRAAKVNRMKSNGVNDTFDTLNNASKKAATNSPPLIKLFQTRSLRKTIGVLLFNWFVAGLSVFGFTQHISFIGKVENIFVHVAIGGLVTIPGTILCIYFVDKLGRKNSIIASGILYGSTCILVGTVPAGVYAHDWPKIFLAGISLTCMSITFPALYLYSGELLPTVVRNGGLGLLSMSARIGSMIAPFVLSTRYHSEFLPLLILGGLPLAAVLLLLLMPETRDRPLPENFEDGEYFEK